MHLITYFFRLPNPDPNPNPNPKVLGAYSLTSGAAAALVLPGAEGLVLLGCGGLWLGCEGMHGTPEVMLRGRLTPR